LAEMTCANRECEMVSRLARFCIAVIVASATGCDAAGNPDDYASAVRDSGRVRIVDSNRPAFGENAWTVANEPTVLIGSADTEDLLRPRDARRLVDGRIVVTDEMAHQLKFFSPTGSLLSAKGREGQGPGEFGYIWSVEHFAGDSLMVYDYSQRRVSILDSAGNFGRSFAVTFGPNYWAQGVLRDSLVFLASPGEGRRRTDITGIYWDSTFFVLYRGPDLPVDTIGRYALSEQPGLGGGQPRPYHFGHRMQFALADDEFYMGSSVTYEIGRYTSRGELAALIRRKHVPVQVTAERKARFREAYAALVQTEEGGVSPEQLERTLRFVDNADYPDHFPAYSAMLVDHVGNLWVEDYRVHTERESTWSVFDPEGRWVTSVRMPDGLQVLDIGDNHVLGFMKDDTGLERVALYSLLKSTGTA
jgi:hypothetical protein